eukprot:GILI01020797.1.p1 GENE.GILI01020797.1~~GILI01020797.1.p1  ORF type:complete len:525 (+),score=119.55 GILI01020797.1:166-1575(+)
MPPKGAEARGAAVAELAKIIHEGVTDPKLKALLDGAKADTTSLSFIQKANLREIERRWNTENKLSSELVEKLKLAESRGEAAWRTCRANNDWETYVPYMKEMFSLLKKKGELLAAGTDLHPYEALMHIHEPGASLKDVKSLFDDIKSWLPKLLSDAITAQDVAGPIKDPQGPFPIQKQEALGREMMNVWKFDFDGGRLDVSAHPCCIGVPEDVRLTTRYSLNDFGEGLLGVIHETGHGKYEQNRPRDLLDQPVSLARSMGIHESQSLFAEMQIGRSAAFQKFLLPKAIATFGDQEAFEINNFTRYVQKVEAGPIRVDADEVSYPLHVILRFEIEFALIDGTLTVEEIPAKWNELMKCYLGLDMSGNHRQGVLQDIHWPSGAVGYFPTYTLGAIYAAQFMEAVNKELGEAEVKRLIETGDLGPILDWQKRNIWENASIYETPELVQKVTGKPIDAQAYRQYLVKRYIKRE